MIRVLIADDHPLVRAGLEQLIGGARDMEVVASARDGCDAVELASTTRPDVALMDLLMPRLDGVEATRQITRGTGTRVVVLTSYSDRDKILEALDAGAIGYLLKDVAADELLGAIRTAQSGESPLAPKAASALLAEAKNPEPELTGRERDVLRLLARGLANKQIARELGLSEQTVKSHLTSIFARLDVTDRTGAALWAQRHGLGDAG